MKHLFSTIESNAESVNKDQCWYPMKSLSFGSQSPAPLKVKVANNNASWRRGWTEGCQSYSRDLSPAQRRRFAENCQNPMTIDADALPKANRAAINTSGSLLMVAPVGPIFDDLDSPISAEVKKLYEIESDTLPENIRNLYVRRVDGKYEIPLHVDPPADWILSKDDVYRLLKYDDFVNDVGEAHRLLVDEGSKIQEEAQANLNSGSDTRANGTT